MAESQESVADLADRYFSEGHNCAQAVLRAVAEAQGLSCARCIPAVALAMGGGIGHTGKACGALTGGVMAVGLAADRLLSGSIQDRKQVAYRLAGVFVQRFAEQFGSPDCATLLGFHWDEPGALERAQRENVHQTRCTPFVRWAAEETARVIAELRESP